jgi:membrane-bound ClpP family serine protease
MGRWHIAMRHGWWGVPLLVVGFVLMVVGLSAGALVSVAGAVISVVGLRLVLHVAHQRWSARASGPQEDDR